MCHLEEMPGKCDGSSFLPDMVMVGLHIDVIYPSFWGISQSRAPSKVRDIVKCFCKSTTLYITKRCRLRNRVVHVWCTFGPLSIVLYLSSDYQLVFTSTLVECVGNHSSPSNYSIYCPDRDSIPVSQDTMLSNLCLRPLSHRGWQVHWCSGNMVNPRYSPITKSIRTQMEAILVRHGQ